MKLVPTWLPLSFLFWVGAAVPLIVWFDLKDGIPNGLIAGASTAVIPASLFAWSLSNRLSFKLPRIRTGALLGLVYGVGHVIVLSASPHFLTQQLTGHIELAHFVNLLYVFGVPCLIAKYSSRELYQL
jgi:hypothetical protein